MTDSPKTLVTNPARQLSEAADGTRTEAEALAERCFECGGKGRVFSSRTVQVLFGHESSLCPSCHRTGRRGADK